MGIGLHNDQKCNLTLAVSPTCPQTSAYLQATFSMTSHLVSCAYFLRDKLLSSLILYTSESVMSS